MRIGLIEMKNFCLEFFDDVKEETFLEESAGVADLITSCQLPDKHGIGEADALDRYRWQEQTVRGGLCADQEGGSPVSFDIQAFSDVCPALRAA